MKTRKSNQRDIIAKSHLRCREFGIDEAQIFPRRILTKSEVASHLAKYDYLLRIASPFIDIIYDTVAQSGFFILLTDQEGCILRSVGDPEIIVEAEKLNMVVGAYMNEQNIGTNAMGTAISENQSIQVTASEHFISAYHRWTCSAAPIHDSTGKIIGTLNLTGESHLVHPHTLGFIVAAVHAIENQISTDKALDQFNEAFSYLKSIVESVSAGIIALDLKGNIKTINNMAASMLKLSKDNAINQTIKNALPDWEELLDRFNKGGTYVDMETIFVLKNSKEKYDLSAYPILDKNQTIIGVVLVIKLLQKIYNLVNKYTGMQAYYHFDDIIGNSTEFTQVMEHATQISRSSSTVLIMGESGTGKELIAQSIHNASIRSNSVFIAVNCGALPKSLIESELFGYEEGAFTGSKKGGYAGKFELANGGTIFLDEIGEMPLDMQVSLLRVLQEGYVTRVGSSKTIPVCVRVIAATKKNLFEEVRKGTFREDLFYRLSVIPLFLPPLRKRGNDRIILFNHFLLVKSRKLNKPLPMVSSQIMEKVMKYDWPGNVRELENYVENIVNFNGLSSYDIFNSSSLNSSLPDLSLLLSDKYENEFSKTESGNNRYSLNELEKKAIVDSVRNLNGNYTMVSRELGISRTTLYSKMKKYKIALK